VSNVSKQKEYKGKWWAFTFDGKQFFSLGLLDDDDHHSSLLDAYERHPKRRPADAKVEFVYRDETSNGQKIVQRFSMADILAYEEEMRQIREDPITYSLLRRRPISATTCSIKSGRASFWPVVSKVWMVWPSRRRFIFTFTVVPVTV